MLVWARESIGYTIDETAHRLGNVNPEKVKAWENGTSSPTYTQLENLAYKVFKRPLAVCIIMKKIIDAVNRRNQLRNVFAVKRV